VKLWFSVVVNDDETGGERERDDGERERKSRELSGDDTKERETNARNTCPNGEDAATASVDGCFGSRFLNQLLICLRASFIICDLRHFLGV
jgi:hypothetical protein